MILGRQSRNNFNRGLVLGLVFPLSRRYQNAPGDDWEAYLLSSLHVLREFDLAHAPRAYSLAKSPLTRGSGDGCATFRLGSSSGVQM
jgi:hypothetical protein